MLHILSSISERENNVSNYDKLRNQVVRALGNVDLDKINSIFPETLNINKVFERMSFYYLIRQLVFYTKHHEGINLYVENKSELSQNDFKIRLQRYFNFEPTEANELSKILLKLVRETRSNNINGKSHKKEINEFSFDHNHRCYICGSTVDYLDPSDETSYRTIEHFKPRSLGGNRNTSNLFIACKRCNSVKGDSLSWIEKGPMNIHSTYINQEEGLPDYCTLELAPLYVEEKFENFITDEVIYIVTSLYNYKCAICQTDNDIADGTYIVEKEPDNYFHIFNLMTMCDLCIKDIDKNLSSQNEFIKRKRISNVSN